MKILGVDIGSTSIKVAELETNAKGFALANFFEITIDTVAAPGEARDLQLDVIDALRKLAAQYDPKETRWVFGVSQSRVSLHEKKFPFRERAKIQKSLAFELEDDIPFDVDETVFAAKIVEFDGPLSEVLTIACPKDAVREVLALATDSGIDPEIVSVEGLALANLFTNWEAAPQEKLQAATDAPINMVLQLGHDHSVLLFMRDRTLIGARSLQWGGAEIAAVLSAKLGFSTAEAHQFLAEKSFILLNSTGATREQLIVSNTITIAIDDLVRELRLTMIDFQSRYKAEFSRLEITGGAAQLQNLMPYLSAQLEIPTSLAQPLEELKQVRIELTPRLSLVGGLAVGLALEALKRSSAPAVNLRVDDFQRENVKLIQFWQDWGAPIQAAIAAFVILCAYAVVRDTMTDSLLANAEQHLSEMATKVAGLKGNAANETGIRGYITKAKKQIADRQALDQVEDLNSALDIMAQLAQKLPVTPVASAAPVTSAAASSAGSVGAKPNSAGQTVATGAQSSAPGIEVNHLAIDNEDLIIEGHILGSQTPTTVKLLEAALSEIGKQKSLQKQPVGAVAPAPGAPFSYKLKVARRDH